MGKSQKQQLVNRLSLLIMHLLKWQFQPERRCTSWKLTVKVRRIRLVRILKINPSLKNQKDEIADAYEQAVVRAANETGLLENKFPEKCPYIWKVSK